MPLDADDAALLWDMLRHARAGQRLIGTMTYSQYLADEKSRFAVERALEIVGEAARRISDGTKLESTGIPWAGIIAQRNMIAHEYGVIDHEIIFHVATQLLPELIRSLEVLFATHTLRLPYEH
jgi:uncharacterized protein with HEPN domain